MVPGGMTLWPTAVAVTGVQRSVYDTGDEFSNTCIGTYKEQITLEDFPVQ